MEEFKLPKLIDCINNRRSTRAFIKDKEIENKLLTTIITHTTRAPSWKNIQGYRLIAISGARKVKLCEKLSKQASSRIEPYPEVPFDSNNPSYIKRRAFNSSMSLYKHLGINRKDKDAREHHTMKNFHGYDAPTLIFCYLPKSLASWAILDLGILLGHLVLVCEMYGLGTCLQASLASYPEIVREFTEANDSEKLMVGLSIGYPDTNSIENTFKSERQLIGEIFQNLY